MYKISMRTGHDGQVTYVVQKSHKVLGVNVWNNIKHFKDYNSAKKLYDILIK